MTWQMKLAMGVVLASFAGAFWMQSQYADRLPEKVPIHWNIHNEPDGFVSRDNSFMIFYLGPTTMAGILVLLAVLPMVSPIKYKIEPFRPVYDHIALLVMIFFAYLFAVILATQFGVITDFRFLIGGFFLFFALLGNVLGKVRKNFWVGVRTPWTLASDIVWERTHRMAAWTFVAVGLIGFALVMLGVAPLWCFVFLMASIVLPVVYSLVLYKQLERTGRLDNGTTLTVANP